MAEAASKYPLHPLALDRWTKIDNRTGPILPREKPQRSSPWWEFRIVEWIKVVTALPKTKTMILIDYYTRTFFHVDSLMQLITFFIEIFTFYQGPNNVLMCTKTWMNIFLNTKTWHNFLFLLFFPLRKIKNYPLVLSRYYNFSFVYF